MPSLAVSADVDAFMASVNKAGARDALALGAAPKFMMADYYRSFGNVMASPPTILVGTASAASTLNGARAQYQYDYAAVTNGGTAGAVLNTTGPFRWGGFPAVNAGNYHPWWYYVMSQCPGQNPGGTPQPQYTPRITGASTAEPVFTVEFDFYGTAFEFGMKGQPGANWQLWVNGQPIALATNIGQEGTGTGSHYFIKATFGTADWRRIKLEFGLGSRFAGVVGVAGSSEFVRPSVRPMVPAMVLSDSYGEGGGGTHSGGPSSWCFEMGRVLGLDAINSGVGATGLLADGAGTAGKVKYRDRLVNDVYSFNPAYVFIQASINDRYTNWAATTVYAVSQLVEANGGAYICITAGTSAGSGGPSGTAADITDNTVHWKYLGFATVNLALQNELTLIIQGIRTNLPKAFIGVIGIVGLTTTIANCTSINTALKTTCSGLNVPYADVLNLFVTSLSGVTYMGADFHPTDLGYKMLGRYVAAQFAPYLDAA